MAKEKRTYIKLGDICRGKEEGSSDYIKVDLYNVDSVTLKSGDIIQVETKAQKLKSITYKEENGFITPDVAEKLRANANKMPDFVRATATLIRKD